MTRSGDACLAHLRSRIFTELITALAQQGEIQTKIRQIWSSKTVDCQSIIGLFWQDQFVKVPKYGSHRFYLGESVSDFGEDSVGFRKWREHLNLAWDNNRRILIIEVERGMPNRFFANRDFVMKLIALDKETGAYLAREERTVVTEVMAGHSVQAT
jgi:hypothetical protein